MPADDAAPTTVEDDSPVDTDDSEVDTDDSPDDTDDDTDGDTADADDPGVVESEMLEWSPCEDSIPAIASECATLPVPLDHAAPDGEQIDIAVARIVSTDRDQRIGSLVFNPGGPGGSGVDFIVQIASIMPSEVSSRFDLVSFDPRGVGDSTAIECDVDLDDDIALLQEGDDAAWQELVDEALTSTDECTDASNALAPYVGTNNAARDLDMLREALGDEGLSYVGYSYGTRLGATYAELFRDKVRALVLDAAVLPTDDLYQLSLGQADGFDLALENFAAACDADVDCLLHDIGPTLDVLAGLRAEIAEVGSFPTDEEGRVLTPGELDLGVVAALYSKDTWPFLAQGLFLAEAEQDGTLLQVLTDSYAGREFDGTYDNSQVAGGFINCADDPRRPDVAEVRASNDAAAARSDYFDTSLRASTGCLGAPDAIDPLVIGPATDAPPILVIGNSGDPATPYEWSVQLADSLDSGVLYTVVAEGHTAFGTIDCVAAPVTAYLVDLDVPESGATCSDKADADFFVPAADTDVGLLLSLFDCLRDNGLDVPELDTADILRDPSGESFSEFLDPSDPEVIAAIGQCLDIVAQLQGG